MAKNQPTIDTTPAPGTPATEPVKLRATKKITVAGCTIAPGKVFSAHPDKASEMISAGAAVLVERSF